MASSGHLKYETLETPTARDYGIQMLAVDVDEKGQPIRLSEKELIKDPADLVNSLPGGIALQTILDGYLSKGDRDGFFRWCATVKPSITADPKITFKATYERKMKQFTTLAPRFEFTIGSENAAGNPVDVKMRYQGLWTDPMIMSDGDLGPNLATIMSKIAFRGHPLSHNPAFHDLEFPPDHLASERGARTWPMCIAFSRLYRVLRNCERTACETIVRQCIERARSQFNQWLADPNAQPSIRARREWRKQNPDPNSHWDNMQVKYKPGKNEVMFPVPGDYSEGDAFYVPEIVIRLLTLITNHYFRDSEEQMLEFDADVVEELVRMLPIDSSSPGFVTHPPLWDVVGGKPTARPDSESEGRVEVRMSVGMATTKEEFEKNKERRKNRGRGGADDGDEAAAGADGGPVTGKRAANGKRDEAKIWNRNKVAKFKEDFGIEWNGPKCGVAFAKRELEKIGFVCPVMEESRCCLALLDIPAPGTGQKANKMALSRHALTEVGIRNAIGPGTVARVRFTLSLKWTDKNKLRFDVGFNEVMVFPGGCEALLKMPPVKTMGDLPTIIEDTEADDEQMAAIFANIGKRTRLLGAGATVQLIGDAPAEATATEGASLPAEPPVDTSHIEGVDPAAFDQMDQ